MTSLPLLSFLYIVSSCLPRLLVASDETAAIPHVERQQHLQRRTQVESASHQPPGARQQTRVQTRRRLLDGAKLRGERKDIQLIADASEVKHLDPTKLSWLHIPKTGTSFANSLVSWACSDIAEDDAVDQTYSDDSGAFLWGFMEAHPGKCLEGFEMCGGHAPISDDVDDNCNSWPAKRGNFIAMFRQPEQRMISGFHQNCHDVDGNEHSLHHYSRMVAGCGVKMMNGNLCGEDVQVTDDMLAHALWRLSDGFAFVGLTEEWALSVCLFHAMFGGDCHEREFLNVRPGVSRSEAGYDTSELNGWHDPWDGALYKRATEIFWGNVAKFHVSHDSCAKDVCSQAPAAFQQKDVRRHSLGGASR